MMHSDDDPVVIEVSQASSTVSATWSIIHNTLASGDGVPGTRTKRGKADTWRDGEKNAMEKLVDENKNRAPRGAILSSIYAEMDNHEAPSKFNLRKMGLASTKDTKFCLLKRRGNESFKAGPRLA
jgi:hypothetical protein